MNSSTNNINDPTTFLDMLTHDHFDLYEGDISSLDMDPLASPSATESQSTTNTSQLATTERPSKRQKQSGVWTYYMAVDNGEGGSIQCMVKCLNGSTSGQWKHLKAKHTSVYNELKKQPDRTQRNIDELFQRFNVLLAEWVGGDDQAFTSVECPFFKKMISYLNASASIPSAFTIRNQIVSNYNNNRSSLVSQLSSLSQIVLLNENQHGKALVESAGLKNIELLSY
ncbi:uncharacterized protein BX664DRAFT_359857 [Halteromyces radiatus]|uniref:uncharacterized protein n=1 Tax=Halteromyces radiatus TaxID=101107 RepID=UPI00221FA677|nr:uncharacterized protein BX664DRAFT_359857 [Halteromyces radiatus]KAI8086317.1 hypothetical protein BX664DRAFT_359857 [Halteromyces radiatus]